MTVFFLNDTVLPDDPEGLGNWAQGHYLEHRQFVQMQLAKSPPVFVPDLDISVVQLTDRALLLEWLGFHQEIHNVLRSIANVNGVDLSSVDFSDDTQWFQWMDAHADEHRILRQVFGIVS